jgi:hypothetical protein
VRGRVVAVDSTTEHGDGRTAGLERAAVGLPVDAARHAADDDESRRRQLAPERPRDVRAVRGTGAGADDRHDKTVEHFDLAVATKEQARRWVEDRTQRRRKAGVGSPHPANARGPEPSPERRFVERPPKTLEAHGFRL